MNSTANLFDEIILKCVNTFSSKMKDYGSAWRILRLSSLTDQIFIKAQRIRSLQINKEKKIDEGQEPEFIGIINYSIMALIQIEKDLDEEILIENVKKDKKISNFLEKKSIFKHIIVKNKLVNLIVK